MAIYPGAIPTLDEIFTATDYVDWTNAEKWSNLRAELRAALVELGADPAGTFATVKARLDAMLPHFNDRGDPAAADKTLGDLTEDGAYHDLDLSSIVPAGAKAVLLNIVYRATAVAKSVKFRENGNSNSLNVGRIGNPAANVYGFGEVTVACDGNRVIEYLLDSPETDYIAITVRGWWK